MGRDVSLDVDVSKFRMCVEIYLPYIMQKTLSWPFMEVTEVATLMERVQEIVKLSVDESEVRERLSWRT